MSNKQDLDKWLDQVDYSYLNSCEYVPSDFALTFMNFIKLVNGVQGESHKTPPVHLAMLDKVVGGKKYVANLCFRGSGKTSLMMEYMVLYLAVFGELPDIGSISGLIYISDSMENGVKSARKNIEFRYNSSEFLQQWITKASFTDNYLEFMNKDKKILGVKMFGAKALPLDTVLHTPEGTTLTIGSCKAGDIIMGADGKPTEIITKSEVFHKPLYLIQLNDGRQFRVTGDHLNQVWIKEGNQHIEYTLSTHELLKTPLYVKNSLGKYRPRVFIENCKPIQYSEKDLPEDPYIAGTKLSVNTNSIFLYGSIAQRIAFLQGICDTFVESPKLVLATQSQEVMQTLCSLIRSLGGTVAVHRTKARNFILVMRIGYRVFRDSVKAERQQISTQGYCSITHISLLEAEPSQCIAVSNMEKQFIVEDYIRTHNTGLRGTKIFGKRPVVAILDDLVGDDDAHSLAAMMTIKDTIYKGVNHALDPTNRKIIFSGTPFNKEDILVEAIESGAWDVNVWPVCETFPCTEEEFNGAWPDRFSYAYVKEQYDLANSTGKLAAFYQELMLRLSSEEERMVQEEDIRWYSRPNLLRNLPNYNIYITTDFATSEKKSADNSVISVWAYSSNGDWLWLDGICEKQTMDKNIDELFRLVQLYRPQQVGVEVTGQQGAFIQWLQIEMQNRNIWFNFASSEKSNSPGIRPMVNKLARFNIVLPWFKAGKMYFPTEMKSTKVITQFLQELKLITASGIKGKDDCVDTISMLGFLKPWKPSQSLEGSIDSTDYWDDAEVKDLTSNYDSYLV